MPEEGKKNQGHHEIADSLPLPIIGAFLRLTFGPSLLTYFEALSYA